MHQQVSTKCYEHLKLVPSHLLQSIEFVLKIMWSVVNHFGKLNINKLEREFNNATLKKLDDYYDFKPSEILIFIEKRKGMFKVDK